MRSGPGWDEYANIKKELNPAMENNGLCWVTKEEFFRYFPTIYVCAFNMTRLKDDSYVNDLKNDFKARPKAKPTPQKAAPTTQAESELGPILVNKSSDPSSPYRIVEETFNGGVTYFKMNREVVKAKSIADGVDEFRANPEKYLAIQYQNNMVEQGWPIEVHTFTFYYRDGTEGIEVEVAEDGKKTLLTNVLR